MPVRDDFRFAICDWGARARVEALPNLKSAIENPKVRIKKSPPQGEDHNVDNFWTHTLAWDNRPDCCDRSLTMKNRPKVF